MDKQKYWFFGSKLNTALLLILIILMVIALRWMYQEREKYLPNAQIQSSTNLEPQIEGNKEDLVSFSIKPGQEVSGKVHMTGTLSGGYFFEANVPIAIVDADKKLIFQWHGQGTTDWMTSGPVSFYTDFDFTKMPKGKAYIKITQDDPSGGESGRPIRSIFIPIVIK
jgi:hypothetical protein